MKRPVQEEDVFLETSCLLDDEMFFADCLAEEERVEKEEAPEDGLLG